MDRQADKSNHGKKAGDYADKTYYRAEDGKVVTTPPKGAGSVIVAAGDVITEQMASEIG